MSTVNHHSLLNFPHISPLSRPKLLLPPSSLSLYRKPKHLSVSLSLSPVTIHENSSSSSSSFESTVDGFFYLLRLSTQYHDVEVTKAVHASFLKLREEKTNLGNALISTYLKLGFPRDAFLVFLSLSSPTVVSYTALISGFAKLNLEIDALKAFFKMRSKGIINPNEYTFVAVLTACVRISRFSLGVQIHGLIVKSGFLNSVFVGNSVMSLYAKSSSSDDVVKLFDGIPQRDLASWNTVISSLVKEGKSEKAFDLFYEMNRIQGLGVDSFTLSMLLSSCTDSGDLMRGKELHARAIRVGMKQEMSVNNALIGFYSKFGDITKVESLYQTMNIRDGFTLTEMITAYMGFGMVDSAVEMFENSDESLINMITYNALMAGFCRNGHGLKAIKLFIEMLQRGVELTGFSLTSAVDACGLAEGKKLSEQIHGFCIKFGSSSNPCIQTALLDMCTRCGRMVDAEEMFEQWPLNLDSSKATTSMLGGYARNGLPDKALSLFHRVLCEEKLVLDEVSLSLILAVCGTLGFPEMGCQIHCHAIKGGYFNDVGLGNSLISMYSKCCKSDDAISVFETLREHDIVSWNSLISCYILQRNGDEALALWSRMDKESIEPDAITLALVISSYRYTESNKVSSCRALFRSMKTNYDIEPRNDHYAAFIGVLGHWGFLEEAEKTVNSMPFKPEVSVLKTLLDKCRVHSDESIAKRVSKFILSTNPENPSDYILKSNIYSASGLWHRSETLREEMRENGYRKHPSRSWIIHENKLHSFHAGDTSHPQEKDIYGGLEVLIMECLKAGYEPNTEFVLQEVDEFMKKSFLFHHSAKLAVTYGVLITSKKKVVRVVKNVMLCGDCHEFLKYVSVVVKREIVLRDSSGFHRIVNGTCACRDLW